MTRVVIVLALLAACAKKKEDAGEQKPVAMPAAEVQRSQDACMQYVDKVCACATTVPAVAKQCELARALPEAIRIGLETAASPDSKPDIVQMSYASVRKTAKECIEQLAKLPALGCPAP